jgi:hypothetical protein
MGCAHRGQATLSDLHQRLALIQGPADLGGGEVSSLVGMEGWIIRDALGASSRGEWSHGASVFPATWEYDFFRVPEGVNGGGQVLVLKFDPKGICISASWRVEE